MIKNIVITAVALFIFSSCQSSPKHSCACGQGVQKTECAGCKDGEKCNCKGHSH